MKKILVGVDFSAGTRELVDSACRMAKAVNGCLRLLHVAAPDPCFVGYEPGPQSVRDSVARKLRTEHARLQDMADDLSSKGVQVDALLVQGETSRTLLDQAEQWGADAIVLGNRGHGVFRKAVIGSVGEGVLRDAGCAVIFLRVTPPGE